MSDFPVPQRHPASVDHIDPNADENFINAINGCRRTGRFMIAVFYIENGQIQQDTLIQNFPNGDFARSRALLQKLTDQLERPQSVSQAGEVAAVAPSAADSRAAGPQAADPQNGRPADLIESAARPPESEQQRDPIPEASEKDRARPGPDPSMHPEKKAPEDPSVPVPLSPTMDLNDPEQ